MSEMAPERLQNAVYIQAVDYARNRSEPGEILAEFGPQWGPRGISPDNMMRGVEYIYGSKLTPVARVALGGWAQEIATQHNDQQAQQGEL